MRFERFLILIGLGFALASPSGSRAADVIPVHSGSPCHIRLVGDISSGDAKRIEDAFSVATERRPIKINDPLENSTVICLDSPGGSYVEALRIMDLLKDRGIGTEIERDSRCYSACAFIFMAGQVEADEGMSYPWRQMHFAARLGFHAPYFNLDKEVYSKEEVQRLIQGLTATTSWLLRNSERSSIPASLISEMLRFGPTELLDVDNVLLAGRWKLDPYGLSVPVRASDD